MASAMRSSRAARFPSPVQKRSGGIAPPRPPNLPRCARLVPLLRNPRQGLVGMEGWWRRQCPLKGCCAFTPIVRGDMLFRGEGPVKHVEEHQERDPADIGAERG